MGWHTVLVTTACIFLSVSSVSCKYTLPNGGQIKAVLVAGSSGFDNYRHQADVCHAYQILHNNGIPDENIIVMMYDDIANNSENTNPGMIINVPGGPDVYTGVPKDYTGKDVTKENFFNVLTGNKSALSGIGSGRVLESGPNDHVFINFVDHGGPGVLLMPEEEITANELIDVLKVMNSTSRYGKMFLYIEACESGSIFDNLLPDDLNIFVMTAADPHESSYACFYDEKLQTYLADVFSATWMQNTQSVDLRKETVNHQFQLVRHQTNTSHVEEYGDIDIGVTKMSEVLGYNENVSESNTLHITDTVPSQHVPLAILGQRITAAKSLEEKERLREKLHFLMEGRKKIEHFFLAFLRSVFESPHNNIHFEDAMTKRPALKKENSACFDRIVKLLSTDCFSISKNPFAASHLHKVINLCRLVDESVLVLKLSKLCQGKRRLVGII